MKLHLPSVLIATIVVAACAVRPAEPPDQPSLGLVSTVVPSETETPAPVSTPVSGFTALPTAAFVEDCLVIAKQNGIRLEIAPFISQSRLLPTMEPGVVYSAVDIHPTYFQLARDNTPVGWVDYRIIGVSSDGAGCPALFDRPADTRPLTDFPGLCFFTPIDTAQLFADSDLTDPALGVLSAPETSVVLWKTTKSVFTSFGHAGPSFYVAAADVAISGECAGVPTSGTVSSPGWLRSAPDGRLGEDLIPLPVGTQLHIEGAPVSGRGPLPSSADGQWFQAVLNDQETQTAGWVWSEFVTLE